MGQGIIQAVGIIETYGIYYINVGRVQWNVWADIRFNV
jgi:hypothetical protein